MALPLYIDGRFDMLTFWPAVGAILMLIYVPWQTFRGRLVEAAVGAVLLEILILAPTLHVIIPKSDGLWLSRSAVQAVERYSPAGGSDLIVAAAGYHEPSLVFLCGRQTKLVSAREAALHLRQSPHNLALIRDKLSGDFGEALSHGDESVQLVESI